MSEQLETKNDAETEEFTDELSDEPLDRDKAMRCGCTPCSCMPRPE